MNEFTDAAKYIRVTKEIHPAIEVGYKGLGRLYRLFHKSMDDDLAKEPIADIGLLAAYAIVFRMLSLEVQDCFAKINATQEDKLSYDMALGEYARDLLINMELYYNDNE